MLGLLRVGFVVLVAWGCVRLARHIDLHAVGSALRAASPSLVLAAAALNLVQVYVRALCLRVLLAPVRDVSTGRLLRYTFAFYAANNLLPGRGGEWVRVLLLKSRHQVPAGATLSIAIIEKAFDAIALLLLALPLPWLIHRLPPSVNAALALLGALGVAGLVAAWIVARWGAGSRRFLSRFAEGASVVQRPRSFVAALALSLLAYAMDAVMVALCLAAVGLHVQLAAAPLVLLALGVALAVPSTPSGLGAFELAAVAALALLGIDGERALAFALVYHFMQLVPVTLIGLDGLRLVATVATKPSPPPPE